MPGDKIGSIGGKEHGGALQVVIAAKAAEWNLLQEGVPISFDHYLRHARGKPARGDGVDLDVVNPPFAGQIFGKGDDAAFAGVIPNGLKFWRRTSHARYRSDVNDLPAALRHHQFSDGLRKEECAGQIRLDDF